MRKNFEARTISWSLWLLCFVSIGVLTNYLTSGPTTIPILESTVAQIKLSLALRIDALSSAMFVMVALLSAIVGQYALRYLDGGKRQGYFYRYMLVTVGSVSLLVLSSNLVMFYLAWLGISWGIHNLLMYYPERPAAIAAARKKFLVSRFGDLMILGAVILLYKAFGTFEFSDIFARAAEAKQAYGASGQTMLSIASLLLVAGAMTKSVQFPFHFWLPETMETPTPVSALMHAGVINAGGFLVIRLSPMIAHSELASTLLALVGAFTAVYAALVMVTQSSIKSKLAYSTISQMGMMMFACGIGAYNLALFHIIAHSFYKANAFLTTGGLVEEQKRISLPLQPISLGASLMLVAASYSLVVLGNSWQSGAYLSLFTYLAVLALGLGQSMRLGSFSIPGLARFSVALATTVAAALIAYLVMEHGLSRFLGSFAGVDPNFALCSVTFAVFAAGFLLSRELMRGNTPIARRLYMAIWNDSYLNIRTNRALTKLWPI